MLFFARNLAKRYAAGTDGCSVVARVLDGVDLELRAGTILGIVGGRASGKTTLLRCVAGLARPDRGALRWAPAALRPRITALAPAVHPYETVRDVASRACGDPMISPDRLAAEFAALGLSHLMARSQAALTTDERARLALAIGAATRHPLLLLDGTADALSAAARPCGRACLERVAQQGGAVLLTGRDPAAVQALAARVLRLADGRLCDADAPGTPRAPARVAERGAATSLR